MADTLDAWLDPVISGEATMSQRGVCWVEAKGGLDVVVGRARVHGVQLLQLTDDQARC